MKLGVTEWDEQQVLRAHVPRLFERPGNLLYVGANQLRPPHHAGLLREMGWRLHLLEIFPGNVEHHRSNPLWKTLTQGDIRTAALANWIYDVAFWWHGCEHVGQHDVGPALARLEAASSWVVLGCPHGDSPQAAVYGNAAEEHQWSVYPADLEAHGYTVVPYDTVGRRHLLAWKACNGL